MQAASIEISQLNHASVLLVMGDIRLLIDPWFEGSAFDDGWGLKWANPNAYKQAATATHLWISHPHSDHLHLPTLKKVQQTNPDIVVLANHAYNYDLSKQIRQLGFRDLVTFKENQIIELDQHCTVQRIGSGIIDSLLVIRWQEATIVNLNDCVLQKQALRCMTRKIGPIDLLLCNFNHAGKLLHYPERSPQQVRDSLLQHFQLQIRMLKPKYAIPFASLHRYTSPFSLIQNDSLLEPADLNCTANECTQVISLYPGEQTQLDISNSGQLNIDQTTNERQLTDNSEISAHQKTGVLADHSELLKAINCFERRIFKAYGPLRILLPTIIIKIANSPSTLSIRWGKVTMRNDDRTIADIESYGPKILNWFNNPYGTDAFVVGAHFRILRPCIGKLKLLIAILLLAEAHVSPRYLFSIKLWKFLWHRKHEMFAAILSFRVTSSYQ